MPRPGRTGYLFWDEFHPTTQAGQCIGDLAAQSVPEPTSLIMLATSVCGLDVWTKVRGRILAS